jgi:hypothetical protein
VFLSGCGADRRPRRGPGGVGGASGGGDDAPRDHEALHDREHGVHDEREDGDEDRGRQQEGEVARGQAGEDVAAEAAEPEEGPERDGADDLQGRRAEAADDERERERDLDPAEDLPLRHPDRAGRVDGGAVDRLDARVHAGEQRGDAQDGEREDRTRQADAEEQAEEHEHAERRQGAQPAREGDGDVAPAPRVADVEAGRDGDERREAHREARVPEVLEEAGAVSGAAAPPGAVEEEAEGLGEEVHEALASVTRAARRAERDRARRDGVLAHGMRSRPASSRIRSKRSEITRMPTMPVRISV